MMQDLMASTGRLPNGFTVWQDRAPDQTRRVAVGDHAVTVYSCGSGEEVLFLLNGGPGLPCDHLREPHLPLLDHGHRIVVHDQLGTGQSDHPDDPALWPALYRETLLSFLNAQRGGR